MKKLFKITLTLFFVTIIVFGFALPVNMAGNWYQQFLPNIGSQVINDITFLDSLTGYAVTSRNVNPDTASILKTTNGGDNWQVIFSQSPRRFSRIKFINSTTGFVCGGSGGGTPQLYKTINGGTNWSLVSSFGCSFWDDMYVLNNDTIWVVDNNSGCGGVLRTTNGGFNWVSQLNLGSQNPNHIYMYNAKIGFICKDNLYLRRTTNSGINWDIVPGAGGFTDMYFKDSLTGWKTSFQKTTDGGLNWINQTLPQGGNIVLSQIDRFSVLSGDTIWGVGGYIFLPGQGNRGMIYRSTNGGNNWLYQIPDTSINIGRYLYTKFTSRTSGWAYTTLPTGVHTTSGGDPVWLTGIEQISNIIPKEYYLGQNYPNPFNPKTNIEYKVSERKFISIIVYDITGKSIIDLVNKTQSAGIYKVDFTSTGLSSGVYFYSLFVNGALIATKKMILIK